MAARQLAALCAAFAFVAASEAVAADFGGRDRYNGDYGYDDAPGYHGRGYNGSGNYATEDYGDDYAERGYDDLPPTRGSVKDGYPIPQGPRYSERYDDDRGCVPSSRVRQQLRDEGWRAMRPLETEGRLATIQARRAGSWRLFTLKVDKCSGEIVAVRRHYLREYGAYDERPWRRGYRNY